jgi:F420H(2)-dependent biliverdin reductase
MALDPQRLGDEVLTFVRERHLATLTTLRADGSPHVVPVGFTFEPETRTVRVITWATSMKARHAARGGRAAVSQVDGGRWLTFEGAVSVSTDTDEVAKAVAMYAERYREPKKRDDRVVVLIAVDRVMGRG